MLKSSRFKVAVSVVILVLSSLSLKPASAQAFHRIFGCCGIEGLSWSTDNKLSFIDGDPLLLARDQSRWREYNPITQRLTDFPRWPRQPVLSGDELAFYRPFMDDEFSEDPTPPEPLSFIFSSPNSRYLVFGSEHGQSFPYPIWIADRQTGEMAETYTRSRGVWRAISDLNVIWNRLGTAFIVTNAGSGYGSEDAHMVGYMTNFTENVRDITVMSPQDMNFTVDGEGHIPAVLYGISDDGKHVLMDVYDNAFAHQLMVWNADTNTGTLVGDFDGEKVAAAMFDNGNPDNLVLFSDRGVSRYTISNGHHQLLTTQVKTEEFVNAAFSWDGRWLAVRANGLFVFDLDSAFMGLKAQAYADPTSRFGESEVVFPHLNVVNTGDWPLDMGKIKLRYYFDAGDDQPLNAVCWAALLENGCQNVTISVGEPENEYTTYRYVEVGFKAGTLPAHAETGEVIVRVNKQDWSSFAWHGRAGIDDNKTETFIDQPEIPVLYDGKMVWGVEP